MKQPLPHQITGLIYSAIALCTLAFALWSDFLDLHNAYKLPLLMIFTATTASIYGLFWGFLAAGVSASLLAYGRPTGTPKRWPAATSLLRRLWNFTRPG